MLKIFHNIEVKCFMRPHQKNGESAAGLEALWRYPKGVGALDGKKFEPTASYQVLGVKSSDCSRSGAY